MDPVLDVLRKETESCDCLQAFQISHSLGGGTGSGMGTLLLSKLREEYPDKMTLTFSVFPSPKVSNTVVEPYNTCLSVSQLADNSDEVMCIDNEALFEICSGKRKLPKPTFDDMNQLVTSVMSGVTCSMRFPGQLNCDLRKLAVNLVPFPRLHFFMISLAPLSCQESIKYDTRNIQKITKQMFNARNTMIAASPNSGLYLTGYAIYRGCISTIDIEMELLECQRTAYYPNFAFWIPSNLSWSCCNIPPKGMKTAATFIGNSTSITTVFKRVEDQFTSMFKKRAFVH